MTLNPSPSEDSLSGHGNVCKDCAFSPQRIYHGAHTYLLTLYHTDAHGVNGNAVAGGLKKRPLVGPVFLLVLYSPVPAV